MDLPELPVFDDEDGSLERPEYSMFDDDDERLERPEYSVYDDDPSYEWLFSLKGTVNLRRLPRAGVVTAHDGYITWSPQLNESPGEADHRSTWDLVDALVRLAEKPTVAKVARVATKWGPLLSPRRTAFEDTNLWTDAWKTLPEAVRKEAEAKSVMGIEPLEAWMALSQEVEFLVRGSTLLRSGAPAATDEEWQSHRRRLLPTPEPSSMSQALFHQSSPEMFRTLKSVEEDYRQDQHGLPNAFEPINREAESPQERKVRETAEIKQAILTREREMFLDHFSQLVRVSGLRVTLTWIGGNLEPGFEGDSLLAALVFALWHKLPGIGELYTCSTCPTIFGWPDRDYPDMRGPRSGQKIYCPECKVKKRSKAVAQRVWRSKKQPNLDNL